MPQPVFLSIERLNQMLYTKLYAKTNETRFFTKIQAKDGFVASVNFVHRFFERIDFVDLPIMKMEQGTLIIKVGLLAKNQQQARDQIVLLSEALEQSDDMKNDFHIENPVML